jgi:TorA maturation chaperone TorD
MLMHDVEPAVRGKPGEEERNRLTDLAGLRSRLYRWLASAFLSPDPERRARLQHEAQALLAQGLDGYPFSPHLLRALKALQSAEGDGVRTAEAHTSLFNLPADRASCPPLGCDYLSERGGTMFDELARLDGFYQKIGIEPRAYIRERPDHLSVELEALGVLALVEADAGEGPEEVVQAARQAAERFLRLHVLCWFPRFRERVRANDSLGTYACLADAAHAFLAHDQALLRAMLHEVQEDR